jgi:hypothetical protein
MAISVQIRGVADKVNHHAFGTVDVLPQHVVVVSVLQMIRPATVAAIKVVLAI